MRWNWYRIAVWAFALAFLIYMVIVPTTEWIMDYVQPPKPGRKPIDELSLSELIRMRSIEAIIAFIFFAIGAAIGSFLNVVVFRMPRGESVIFKPSSCPDCGTKIKGRDNVPVFGWLLLNGKCRSCNVPISSRYPIVEMITGCIFLLFYFVELISGGDNIPVRHPNMYRGVVWIIFYTKWDLVTLYLFHCFAICVLLTWALIDVDRYRIRRSELLDPGFQPVKIPRFAIVAACLALLIATVLRPDLQPVPWQLEVVTDSEFPKWVSSVGTGILGGLLGAFSGWLARVATTAKVSTTKVSTAETNGSELGGNEELWYEKDLKGESLDEKNPIEEEAKKSFCLNCHSISAGLIVGLSVGWQAAIGVWLLAFALRPVIRHLFRIWKVNEPSMTVILLVAYLVHLLAWRQLDVSWWPSKTAAPVTWAAAVAGMAILWGLNRSLPANLQLLAANFSQPELGERGDFLLPAGSELSESELVGNIVSDASLDEVEESPIDQIVSQDEVDPADEVDR